LSVGKIVHKTNCLNIFYKTRLIECYLLFGTLD
jgi:hypothetical protein